MEYYVDFSAAGEIFFFKRKQYQTLKLWCEE